MNRGVAQSCWCQWHSVSGTLPAGTRASECARASFTQSFCAVCLEGCRRARERLVKECARVSLRSQLTAGRRWSFATQQTFDFFPPFCFALTFYAPTSYWNVLFVKARGGHSLLHLFISYFNFNSIVLYIKHLWQHVSGSKWRTVAGSWNKVSAFSGCR